MLNSKSQIHTEICRPKERYMATVILPSFENDALRQLNIKVLSELAVDQDVLAATRQRAADLAELLHRYGEASGI